MTGAVALSLVPVAVRNATGGGIAVEAAISGFFAFGIGAGSLAAAVLAQRPHQRSPRRPAAALGMAVFLVALASVDARHRGAARPGDASLGRFFATAQGLAIAVGRLRLGGVRRPLRRAVFRRDPGPRRARQTRPHDRRGEYPERPVHGGGLAGHSAAAKPLIRLSANRLCWHCSASAMSRRATYIGRAIVRAEANRLISRRLRPAPESLMILDNIAIPSRARPRCAPMSPNRSASPIIGRPTI